VLLIGTLLVGIVFFNVDILRLNRSIATTGEKATALRQENARLLLLRARLGSSERIQQAAAADGMVLPAPGEVRYLRSDPRRDARRAAQRVLPPSPVPPPPATPQTGQTPGTPAPASPTPGTNGTAVPTGTTTTTGVTSPTTPQVSTTTPPSTGAPTTSAPTSVSQQPTGVATP
jgi:cell division protein FtsL